jgi:ABC-2 type transport system ATP-binding protein
MIQVRNVSKSYGSIDALRGINFDVDRGEIVGLLGPNGAGKSTAIKILTGYLHPDTGSVTIDGLDVLAQPQAIQQRLGYLAENTPLYPDLSVQAYLRFIADIRRIPSDQQIELISEAVYATGMHTYLTRPIAALSKGMRQRVALSQAILHRPKLLILDEPTVGLDPTQVVEMRGLIKRLAGNSTILFSSHILSEVEAVCDRVIIMMNGQIKADARLDELSTTTDATLVLQQFTDGVDSALLALEHVTGVEAYTTSNGYPAYHIRAEQDIFPAIFNLARQHNWPLRELKPATITLENVFNQLATSA